MRRVTNIKNGGKFTLPRKNAVIERSKAIGTFDPTTGKKITVKQIADEFTVGTSTLSAWRRAVGIQRPQPAQFAAHQAHKAAQKAFKTPILLLANGNELGPTDSYTLATHIRFKGQLYVV